MFLSLLKENLSRIQISSGILETPYDSNQQPNFPSPVTHRSFTPDIFKPLDG